MGCKGVFITRTCLHDGECELKKRLNVCKQYKIFTAFWDFIPKCRSWRIVDAVKDKKKEKKKIKIKTTKAKKEKEKKNKRLSPSWDSNHDRLRGKQGSYPLDSVLYHMASKQISKIFVQISVHRMGDQELKHITICSQLNFFKSAKRSRKS